MGFWVFFWRCLLFNDHVYCCAHDKGPAIVKTGQAETRHEKTRRCHYITSPARTRHSYICQCYFFRYRGSRDRA